MERKRYHVASPATWLPHAQTAILRHSNIFPTGIDTAVAQMAKGAAAPFNVPQSPLMKERTSIGLTSLNVNVRYGLRDVSGSTVTKGPDGSESKRPAGTISTGKLGIAE